MSFVGNTTAYPTVSPAGADLVPLVQGGVLKTATAATIAALATSNDQVVTALSIAAGVVNIDLSLGSYYTLTLTANVTSITFSNAPGAGKGYSKVVKIVQGAGPYTVAWPASFKWANGAAGAVSVTNGAVDVLGITSFDNGTTNDVTLANAFA